MLEVFAYANFPLDVAVYRSSASRAGAILFCSFSPSARRGDLPVVLWDAAHSVDYRSGARVAIFSAAPGNAHQGAYDIAVRGQRHQARCPGIACKGD